MPANIPSGSHGGLWFLVAFGAITWFVSVSRCFGASTVLHQDEGFLRFYFYSQINNHSPFYFLTIMVLEGHLFQ